MAGGASARDKIVGTGGWQEGARPAKRTDTWPTLGRPAGGTGRERTDQAAGRAENDQQASMAFRASTMPSMTPAPMVPLTPA